MASGQRLILSVQGSQTGRSPRIEPKVFDASDGRIGRADDCDWVLSTVGVSRLHALVRYLNDIYFIEDRSTNGMLLNGEPMRKGDPAALKDGDRLQIDCFEVSVNLVHAEQAAPMDAPVVAAPPLHSILSAEPAAGGAFELIPEAGRELVPGGGLDPLEFFDAPYHGEVAVAPVATSSWNHTPSFADRFRPPHAESGHSEASPVLPEHWDLTEGEYAQPSTVDAPAPEHESVSAESCEAIQPVSLPDAASPPLSSPSVAVSEPKPADPATKGAQLEILLQVAVGGLIDALRARAELKNSFRLPATLIQRSENNPLKFAPDAQNAVEKLLSAKDRAFLSGTEALQDAIEDIQHHQLAMLCGMRAGFRAMLAKFDPARYEHEGESAPRRLGFASRQTHPWARYREEYAALTSEPDECFRHLFGDSFAQAYEEQVAELKARGPRTAS